MRNPPILNIIILALNGVVIVVVNATQCFTQSEGQVKAAEVLKRFSNSLRLAFGKRNVEAAEIIVSVGT